MVKGDYDCICDCCVHWRRHVHKVAAKRDKVTGRVQSTLEWTTKTLNKKKDEAIELRFLVGEQRKQIQRLQEVKKPGIFSWIFGG